MGITTDVQVPSRSRTFTQDDAQKVLTLLRGTPAVEAVPAHKDESGNDVPAVEAQEATPPAKNVGFGEFKTAGAARSAGVTLNRLLSELGADQKYAVTTFERDGKIVGVMLNKPAKERATADAAETPAEGAPPQSSRRRSRR